MWDKNGNLSQKNVGQKSAAIGELNSFWLFSSLVYSLLQRIFYRTCLTSLQLVSSTCDGSKTSPCP